MARALRQFDIFTAEGHEFTSLFLAQMAKLIVYTGQMPSVCLSVCLCASLC